ncbi:porin family protein [Catalinimonas niigatensis]|uniref:porin n=1 Tax=Catalinimonas niigatensis TaxID=1397264 RepID=UPI002666A1AE|nr:porin [Catalinimonas niigatensis]WPP51999.1 porin [Catalinimonas niigatensis]
MTKIILLSLLSCMPILCAVQTPEEKAEDKLYLKVGGALRFHYNLSTWKDDQVKRAGDFGYDMFRLNVEADFKGIKLNAKFRHYSQVFGGAFLKHGWFQYDFSEQSQIQVGLQQVPFGIQQYNSNNWFLI